MSHPAPGTMTTEQAQENVIGMVRAFNETDLQVGVERAMDAIAKLGREAVHNGARGVKPAADYRLMWNAAREMRSTLVAGKAVVAGHAAQEEAPAAGRTLGTVPAKEGRDLSELAELEKRAAAGHYAVEGEDGMLRFYKLDVPTEGRWAGCVFVKQVTGHVGEEGSRVRHPAKRLEVLAAIEAAGPVEAEKRYGQEIGRCSRCHRVLTNEESRAYGIGPECRQK